jgi:hypothetical protein
MPPPLTKRILQRIRSQRCLMPEKWIICGTLTLCFDCEFAEVFDMCISHPIIHPPIDLMSEAWKMDNTWHFNLLFCLWVCGRFWHVYHPTIHLSA